MTKKFSLAAFGAAACILGSVAAQASTLEVTVTENGNTVASWDQSSTPTPVSFISGYGTTVGVTNETGLGTDNVLWYNLALGGLFQAGGFNIFGPQAYTGPESAPVFATGSFRGLDQGTFKGPATVTIAVASGVPEISTWAMMLAGFAAIGFAHSRRRAIAA